MITIQLQGGESSREVDAHMAALIAYREQLRPTADTPLPTLDVDGPSGGEQMTQRAAVREVEQVFGQAVQNALQHVVDTNRAVEDRLCDAVQGTIDELQSKLDALPPVPAAPVSAVPPVPPAPSVADAGASQTAPEAPQAGAAPLPPVPPLPPASPSVPVADATPAAQAPAPAADLDSTGLPWDGRIHSESRAKVADGSWRKRRNTDPAVTAQVEQELRALMGIAPAAPASQPQAGTVITQQTGVTTESSDLVPPAAAPVSAVPPAPPLPPLPPAGTATGGVGSSAQTPSSGAALSAPDDFEPWFKRYVSAMQQGKITGDGVNGALAQLRTSHGLATILDLKQRPELRDVFASMVPGLAEHMAQGGEA